VLPIYEGTSGMQALDLVMRRVLGDQGCALEAFLDRARVDLHTASDRWAAGRFAALLDLLEEARGQLAKDSAPIVAYPFLQLASLVTTGWIALRLSGQAGSPVADHLAGLGRHWLRLALPLARAESEQVAMGSDLIADFPGISMAEFG
jgi:hypothetical protein